MIWCVEDDASIRDIEIYALQSTGSEARGFEDGNAFWQALQEQKPQLVLLVLCQEVVQELEDSAQYHNARLNLTSTPGHGTSISVTF